METSYEYAATGDAATNREFFVGQIRPVRLPPGYQLGLFFVALGMVVLPLIYLVVTGLVCWATCWYATHAIYLFFPVVGGERHVYGALLFLYLVPLGAGGVLTLFMFKPLFARWPVREAAFPISHIDHPAIFRFLGQLCQQMGTPIPSRVDVTLGITASAGFREGFGSMFGNDIMLTLGLPLAAGMTCREFAGVVAHELGHFTQRTAMRLGYIIYTINFWLFRAVYERDAFDQWVEDASEENSFSLLLFTLARVAIGFTRGVLWLLLVTGHALSSFMSRQMEFHADACAVAVAGTDGFVGALQKLCILERCADRAAVEFSHRVAPKLPDDLSTFIASLSAKCAGETQGQILRSAAKGKTRWFSSHPADAERIARAAAANNPGIIEDSRPAIVLFNDFSRLSIDLTAAHYQILHRGMPVPTERLFHVVPPTDTPPDTSVEEAAIKAYFGGLGLFLRPLLIDPAGRVGIGMTADKRGQIEHARQTLHGSDILPFRESVKELDARLLRVMQADALVQAGLEVEPATIGLERADLAALMSARNTIGAQQEQLGRALEPFELLAKQRLTAALSLLRTPAIAAAISNTQQLQDEVLDLFHAFGKLSAAFPSLLEMRRECAVLQALLNVRNTSSSLPLNEALAASAERCQQHLARIHEVLGSTQYPFEEGGRHTTIVEHARAKQYDPDPASMTRKEVESHLQALVALYYRLLGRLVAIASQVEAQLETQVTT